jgi:ATP-dependent Clp protease ATP-binding subunit ClpA
VYQPDLMFERFTNLARRTIVLAQDEARGLSHNYIGTEHLLLGLLGAPGGMALQALESYGMSLEAARAEVLAIVPAGKHTPEGHIPFTPRGKKVLELSLREALALKHNYIGTEHVLLGMIREGEGVGAQVLAAHGNLSAIRRTVLDALSAAQTTPTGRRWLRRHAEISGEPEELRTTPAADTGLNEAVRIAGLSPVGSHHLLIAALSDRGTAAARALAAAGVDLDLAVEALRGADVTGTSDELPEERGRRHMQIRLAGDRLIIDVTDHAAVALGQAALEAISNRAAPAETGAAETAPAETGPADTETGPARTEPAGGGPAGSGAGDLGVISGDSDLAISLSKVWQTLMDSLADIRRRAEAAEATEAGQPEEKSSGRGRRRAREAAGEGEQNG